MRPLRPLLVAGLCFLLSSCGSPKPRQAILGEWTAIEDKKDVAVWKFSKDGTLDLKIGGPGRPLRMRGKYHFTDDRTVVLEREPGNPAKNQTLKVSFEKGKLVLIDEDGKVMKFKRPS